MNRTPAAIAAGRALARELGQLPCRRGTTVHIPSRTKAGEYYSVLIGLNGETACTCAGYEYRRDCWHCRYVKEEIMTETSTAIVPLQVRAPVAVLPSREDLAVMDYVAGQLIEAGGVSIPTNLKNKAQVRAVLLAGWEVGVKPMSALRHIGVINGKTEPDAQLMASIIMDKERDARFNVTKETEDETTVRFTRPSRGIDVEFTYTMADAHKAGLKGKAGPWTQFPKDMRRWACIKRLARTYAGDLINGIAAVPVEGLPLQGDEDAEPFNPNVIEGTAIDRTSLYNDGDDDAPEPGPAHDNPAFDEDGAADVPLATDEQLAKVTEWTEALKSKGKAATDAVDYTRRAEWPYAIVNGRFSAAKLTEAHADDYIAVLADAAGDAQTPEGAAEAQPGLAGVT